MKKTASHITKSGSGANGSNEVGNPFMMTQGVSNTSPVGARTEAIINKVKDSPDRRDKKKDPT